MCPRTNTLILIIRFLSILHVDSRAIRVYYARELLRIFLSLSLLFSPHALHRTRANTRSQFEARFSRRNDTALTGKESSAVLRAARANRYIKFSSSSSRIYQTRFLSLLCRNSRARLILRFVSLCSSSSKREKRAAEKRRRATHSFSREFMVSHGVESANEPTCCGLI